jgi:hypothetical protein
LFDAACNKESGSNHDLECGKDPAPMQLSETVPASHSFLGFSRLDTLILDPNSKVYVPVGKPTPVR